MGAFKDPLHCGFLSSQLSHRWPNKSVDFRSGCFMFEVCCRSQRLPQNPLEEWINYSRDQSINHHIRENNKRRKSGLNSTSSLWTVTRDSKKDDFIIYLWIIWTFLDCGQSADQPIKMSRAATEMQTNLQWSLLRLIQPEGAPTWATNYNLHLEKS